MPRLLLFFALAFSLATSPVLPWAGTLFDSASGDYGSKWDPNGYGSQWDPDGDELPQTGNPGAGALSDYGSQWDPDGDELPQTGNPGAGVLSDYGNQWEPNG